jgi:hypothetical protein
VLGDLVARGRPHALLPGDVRERLVEVLGAEGPADHERVQSERRMPCRSKISMSRQMPTRGP